MLAARDGVVISLRQDPDHGGGEEKFKQYANYIAIRHTDGTCAEYLHLQRDSARVQLGETVRTGQVIAASGNTGYSTSPRLHFVVFRTTDGRSRETIPVTFANAAGTLLPLVPDRAY